MNVSHVIHSSQLVNRTKIITLCMVGKGIDDCSIFKVSAAGPSKFMREKQILLQFSP